MRITRGRRRHDNDNDFYGEEDDGGETSSGGATQLSSSIPVTSSAPPSPSPDPATMPLNCGYNCSRYVYYQPVTRQSYDMLTDDERATIKEEYFRTYDLMTGLRTAASLGGTIVLFSLFILYKMKCGQASRRRRRKSMAASLVNVEAPDLLDKEWSSPISENRAGNNSTGLNYTRDAHPSPCKSSVPPQPAAVHGVIPQFRFNAEPCGSTGPPLSLPATTTTSAIDPPSIDIHVTQPTPNVSPCGSVRRLSEYVAADTLSSSDKRRSDAVLIPLLSIPKVRTKAAAAAASKKSTPLSDLGSAAARSRSDSEGQCTSDSPLHSTSANRLPVTFSVGGKRLRRQLPSTVTTATIDIKYIDCSDSDACSSEYLGGDSQPVAKRSEPTKLALPSVHQERPSLARTVLKVSIASSSDDAHTEDVSETQC